MRSPESATRRCPTRRNPPLGATAASRCPARRWTGSARPLPTPVINERREPPRRSAQGIQVVARSRCRARSDQRRCHQVRLGKQPRLASRPNPTPGHVARPRPQVAATTYQPQARQRVAAARQSRSDPSALSNTAPAMNPVWCASLIRTRRGKSARTRDDGADGVGSPGAGMTGSGKACPQRGQLRGFDRD